MVTYTEKILNGKVLYLCSADRALITPLLRIIEILFQSQSHRGALKKCVHKIIRKFTGKDLPLFFKKEVAPHDNWF